MGGWREGGRVEGRWEGGEKTCSSIQIKQMCMVCQLYVPVASASSEIGSHLKRDNKRHHGGQQYKMET